MSGRLRRTTEVVAASLVWSAAVFWAACGTASTPPGLGDVPHVDAVSEPPPGAPLRIDMDAIFPDGAGRELLLNNCTNCHSFVRIVLMQRTRQQWSVVKSNMRPRVAGLSDHDVDTIFDYLEDAFNETRPEPKLPKWLLETETW